MRKYLFATTILAMSSPAFAQAWTPGEGPQPVSYPKNPDGSENIVLGDGSDPRGGIPPFYAKEPADIPDNFDITPWIKTAGASAPASGPSDEAKFRTHCNPSHEAQEDPILYPGVVGGHKHTFWGNTLAGKNSTYSSLRTTGGSTCAGGPVNRSTYWTPSMEEITAQGIEQSVIPDFGIIYYTVSAASASQKKSRIPRDFGLIGGKNPADFNNTAVKLEIPAGYQWATDGFAGWQCQNADTSIVKTSSNQNESPYFVGPGGTDPWAGQCSSGKRLVAVVDAPSCWDGHNARSPDGRSHVRYPIRNNQTGRTVCPTNWYETPAFQGSFFFAHKGFKEYSTWYLASDRMNDPGTAPDPTSLDPCRQTGPYFCPGATWHFDWIPAWSYGTGANPSVMLKWQRDCTGTTLRIDGMTLPGNPHICNDSTFSAVPERLLTNGETSPDSSLSLNPVINFNLKSLLPDNQRFYKPLAGMKANITMSHHHNGVPVPAAAGLVAEGDSITQMWANNYVGLYSTNHPTVKVCGLAVGGSGIESGNSTMVSRMAKVVACNPKVVTVFIGANDMYNWNPAVTTQHWLAKLWKYTDSLRNRGYKVAVATILPQYNAGDASFTTTFNFRRRNEANPAIRAAVGVHYDALIDFAADPTMGPDAAAQNTSLYYDGLHPTDACGAGCGGQGKLYSIYAPVVDSLLGS